MKYTLILIFAISSFVLSHIPKGTKFPITKEALTCYGYSPCNACSNCSACKYCKAGGTCGVCAVKKGTPQKTKSPSTKEPQSSGQCKATTQKGTRCSRVSRSKGLCWQHGG